MCKNSVHYWPCGSKVVNEIVLLSTFFNALCQASPPRSSTSYQSKLHALLYVISTYHKTENDIIPAATRDIKLFIYTHANSFVTLITLAKKEHILMAVIKGALHI